MTTATIKNLSGQFERVSLPKPHFSARVEYATGVLLTALYSGPKTNRRFARFESIWLMPNGECEGNEIRELNESDYLAACRYVGCEPVHVTPTDV